VGEKVIPLHLVSARTGQEAPWPWFALAFGLTAAALAGELAAVISLVRGERLGWLAWIGVAVNGALLLPTIYLLVTADWS
jgi:hypothetical protein